MDGIETNPPENAPMILGYDDGSAAVLVTSTGYGLGFRLGQVGYIAGSDVDDELSRVPPLLVRYDTTSDVDGSDALLDPGNQRFAELVPELGVQPRIGTDADTAAILNSVDHDPPTGLREPAGPASIHDEQSDKRPPGRTRTVNESTADSAAVADQNAESFDESFRDPETETYDLDAPTPTPRRKRTTR